MAEQTLRTWLELDTTRFRAGMDGAKGKVESFERQLSKAKGGIKDAAGTIEGMAQATQGGVAGAVGAVKDFIGLLASNPPLAIFAAVGAAITGLAKLAESRAEEVGKKIDDLARMEAAGRRKMESSLGLDTASQTSDEAKRRMSGASTAADAEARLDAQRKRVVEANAAALSATQVSTMGFFGPTDTDKARVQDTQAALAKEVDLYEAMKKAAEDVRAEEQRRKELTERLNDDAQQQFTEQQRERQRAAQAEQDRKDRDAKARVDRENTGRNRQEDEDARFGRAVKEIGKRKFSSDFDGSADIMARVGGTIGRGLDPKLRSMDLQLQRLEEIKRLTDEHKRISQEIKEYIRGDV